MADPVGNKPLLQFFSRQAQLSRSFSKAVGRKVQLFHASRRFVSVVQLDSLVSRAGDGFHGPVAPSMQSVSGTTGILAIAALQLGWLQIWIATSSGRSATWPFRCFCMFLRVCWRNRFGCSIDMLTDHVSLCHI